MFLAAGILLLEAFASASFVLYGYSSSDGSFGNAADGTSGFGNTTSLSSACTKALNATINCNARLPLLASTGYYMSTNASGLNFCTDKCNSSLASYRSTVQSACKKKNAFGTYATSWRGDIVSDYFNLASFRT
jgi:hypothetical protein